MALTVLQPWGANSAATFTFGGLSVTGNATVGNISATNLGNISSINLTGNSSNVLYGNGIFAAASGGAGTPGGLNTYVQFNDASTFGGNASFTYNKATNTLTAGNIGGTLTTAAQTNITSVGTLSSLAVTGNITSGNLSGTHYGAATGLTSIPGANVTGTVNNSTYFNTVSSVTFAEALRSNRNINGGGTISVDGAAYVGWTSRYIVISNGNGTNFSTSGYFDITQPIVGTITGVGGATNVTATAAGIQLQAWQALYYILPIGSNSASLNANFRIVTFTGALDIPHDWVLICVVNGDNNRYYFNNGITLTAGTSYATATYSSTLVPVASSATTAGTVTTAAQPNITSVGTLTSLAVTGNITSGNFVGTLNGSGANVTSISATNISTGTLAQARLANTSITLGSTALTLGATVTTVAGLTSVTSTTFVGALTGAATTAGTVTTAAQPNITSVGTLTSIAVTGNVLAGNLNSNAAVTGVTVTATGNVTGGNVVTSGSGGNISGANVVSATTISTTQILNSGANAVGNIGTSSTYFNTVFASKFTGTLTTAAQPNITSVGTLTSLAVTGNITSGNFVGTLNGSGANVTSISATNISSGTLTQARLANAAITLGSTALTLGATVTTVAGLTSVTSTTFVGALTGAATTAGTATTATTATNQSGGTINATTGSFSGLLTGASSASIDVNTANDVGSFSVRGNSTTIASVTFHRTGAYAINMGLGVDNVFRIGGWSASANCLQLSGTGAGTFLSSVAATAFNSSGVITATGNITGGNLSVSTGIVTLGSIVNANANAVGNIGSSTKYFNTVFAKATSAQYADLAELYTTDNINYPPGTCVAFGGTDEITQTTTYAQTDVAGVVSTNPAYIMNAGTDGLPVALQGRVPCRVIGTIAKGDLVTSSNIAGVATRLAPDDWRPGAVIGKSLQHFDSETEGVIEVVVGRV